MAGCVAAVGDEGLGEVGGVFNRDADLLALVLRETGQHMRSRVGPPTGSPHTNFQPPKVLRTKTNNRGLDAVLPTGRTTL